MKKIYLIGLAAGLGFLLNGCGGSVGTGSGYVAHPMEDVPPISESDKTAFLDAINDARSQSQDCGSEGIFSAQTTPLTWSDALYKAAYEHNYDMANSGVINLDHTGSGTEYDYTAQVQDLGRPSTFDERIKNNGYTGDYPLLENLTVSPDDPEDEEGATDTAEKAVAAWLASDGHCANLMDPDVREVGMSYLYQSGGTYTHFWTQDFGGGH